MASTETNTKKDGNSQGNGGGGRGGGRGRGRGDRVRRKKKKGAGGNSSGVDHSEWRKLDPDYRDWLVGSGVAVDALRFNAMSTDDRISAIKAYDSGKLAKQQDELIELLRLTVIYQTNPYETISDSHYSQQDSEEARARSIAYYGLPSESFCQIIGQQPQQIKIVNAHIWPRSGAKTLHVFGLNTEDIHSPRNVLRLQKCIERAFDHRELTLVAGADDQLVVKVLNKNLLPVSLKGTTITFGDIHGRPLIILQPAANPYRRLLAHHSLLSHRYAREKSWLTDDLESEEVSAGALLEHSLDQQAQDRIKLLWQQR